MNVHQMIRTILILLLVRCIDISVVKQDTLGIKSQCRVQVSSNIDHHHNVHKLWFLFYPQMSMNVPQIIWIIALMLPAVLIHAGDLNALVTQVVMISHVQVCWENDYSLVKGYVVRKCIYIIAILFSSVFTNF